jgi:hypothetical protein
LAFNGCAEADRKANSEQKPQSDSQAPAVATMRAADSNAAKGGEPAERMMADRAEHNRDASLGVSLAEATSAQSATMAADRKIIRNADVTLETDSPVEGQRRIAAVVESFGGFVITSEFKQNLAAKQSQSVSVVARVPSSRFDAALEQIYGIGKVAQNKVSGQDVSEEYVDIEARIRTKKALEAQFIEIMKQAKKVSDALEVQNELADVRTEIERLEGRRRFLENQSALSTITVNLQLPAPVVATTGTGFGHDVKQAFGDAVDTAAAIVLFLIRTLIILTPFALIFGLPAWFVWRLARRRIRLDHKPAPVAES